MGSGAAGRRLLNELWVCLSESKRLIGVCARPQQRGYSGKLLGGQLKRPGPPLGEHSVIQHTPLPPLHTPSRLAADESPGPSKRKKSSDLVSFPLIVWVCSCFFFCFFVYFR